jgi:hypothetical protein
MFEEGEQSKSLVAELAANELVEEVLLFDNGEIPSFKGELHDHGRIISCAPNDIYILPSEIQTDYLLIILPGQSVRFGQRAIERFLSIAESSGAGWLYSDFKDETSGTVVDHPLIDYQLGSIRDTFDFGSVVFLSKKAMEKAFENHGDSDDIEWNSLYDLRLKLSIESKILRIPEPLYTRVPSDLRATGERQFDYVDPRNREYQIAMEEIATAHLKRVGAYLAPEFLRPRVGAYIEIHADAEAAPTVYHMEFSIRASVIIPVRNRERTIRDAIDSALSQKTDFDFNVIVVDNHSTDRTTEILSEIALSNNRLVHLIPARTDLGIGGCWNEAVYSNHCGEYAVQLDSDDLYADQHTLAKIVAKFEEGPYAMVIGSYTIVNFDLQEIPPGLIDHREWTRENGRNNALRINGLGAPRAFYVPILRHIGLPNVSYGEDYAVALRISRYYQIGRIYESIYFARRWEGNSDASLPIATANRYDFYKDYLRTIEIQARSELNKSWTGKKD